MVSSITSFLFDARAGSPVSAPRSKEDQVRSYASLADGGKSDTAKIAVPAVYRGVSSANAVTLYTAQSLAAEQAPEAKDANAEFLDFMKKTPEQLIRESILRELGLTEDQLAAMDAKDRAEVELKIKELMEEKVEQSMREKGIEIDISSIPIDSNVQA